MGLSSDEIALLGKISAVWLRYRQTKPISVGEREEFARHVSALQTLIMARAAVRAHPDIFGAEGIDVGAVADDDAGGDRERPGPRDG